MTRVTAVIPAYRPGPFLERSLGSVLRQTHQDLEVVVVDDGSPEDFSQTPGLDDPRVRLIHQPNRGVSAARNHAVWAATGEYVAFLDQDDEWLPTKIQKQLAAAEARPAAAFIHTGFHWVLPDRIEAAVPTEDVTYESNISSRGLVCLSTVMVRREFYAIIGGSDVSLTQQQDWDMTLKLLHMFGPAVSVPESLARYHVHGDNASSNYAASAAEAERLYDEHLRLAADRPALAGAIRKARNDSRRRYATEAVQAARRDYRSHDLRGSMRHLDAATRMHPGSLPQALRATVERRLRDVSRSGDPRA